MVFLSGLPDMNATDLRSGDTTGLDSSILELVKFASFSPEGSMEYISIFPSRSEAKNICGPGEPHASIRIACKQTRGDQSHPRDQRYGRQNTQAEPPLSKLKATTKPPRILDYNARMPTTP